LLKVLEDEIVPRLEGMVPNQPSQEQQASDPLLHRFTLIFRPPDLGKTILAG